MFLKPAKEGLIVRHPKTKRPLNQGGEEVTKSTYWLRRIKDGSVIETKKAAAQTATAQPKKKDGGKK